MTAETVIALLCTAGLSAPWCVIKLAEANQRIDAIIAAALAERGDDE